MANKSETQLKSSNQVIKVIVLGKGESETVIQSANAFENEPAMHAKAVLDVPRKLLMNCTSPQTPLHGPSLGEGDFQNSADKNSGSHVIYRQCHPAMSSTTQTGSIAVSQGRQTGPISIPLPRSGHQVVSSGAVAMQPSAAAPGHNVLAEMKRRLSLTFLKDVMARRKREEEQKSQLVPGTNEEYRTPGANYRNKSGRVKRPMNAFMVWAREFRGKLAASMPHATNADISVTLGRVWASLPPEQKQGYYNMAERIKQKHRQDFPNWVYQPTFRPREEIPQFKPRDSISLTGVHTVSSATTNCSQTKQALAQPNEQVTTLEQVSVNDAQAQKIPLNKQENLTDMATVVEEMKNTQLANEQSQNRQCLATVERIPVVLQRVAYPPQKTPAIRHEMRPVSSHTKELLASKISGNRPNQPTGIFLTPTLQNAIARHHVTSEEVCPPRRHAHIINTHPHFTDIRPALRPSQHAMARSSGIAHNHIQSHVPVVRSQLSRSNTPRYTMLGSPLLPKSDSEYFNRINSNVSITGAGSSPPKSSSCTTKSSSKSVVAYSKLDNDAGTDKVVTETDLTAKGSDQSPDDPDEDDMEKIMAEARACVSAVFRPVLAKLSVLDKFKPITDVSSPSSTATKAGQTIVSDIVIPDDDDNWPFSFSQNPQDWSFEDTSSGGRFLELVDHCGPFLVEDTPLEDVFPGALNLDMQRWNKYLYEDDDNSDEPLSKLVPPVIDQDVTISPLPLKVTLKRLLGATVHESDSGDVITGDFVMKRGYHVEKYDAGTCEENPDAEVRCTKAKTNDTGGPEKTRERVPINAPECSKTSEHIFHDSNAQSVSQYLRGSLKPEHCEQVGDCEHCEQVGDCEQAGQEAGEDEHSTSTQESTEPSQSIAETEGVSTTTMQDSLSEPRVTRSRVKQMIRDA